MPSACLERRIGKGSRMSSFLRILISVYPDCGGLCVCVKCGVYTCVDSVCVKHGGYTCVDRGRGRTLGILLSSLPCSLETLTPIYARVRLGTSKPQWSSCLHPQQVMRFPCLDFLVHPGDLSLDPYACTESIQTHCAVSPALCLVLISLPMSLLP